MSFKAFQPKMAQNGFRRPLIAAAASLRLSALSLGFNIAESTHCSGGAFHQRADSKVVPTSIHSTRAAMDAMDASGTDLVPVVCRRKTSGRCRSRPRGASEASDSVAAAALACLVAFMQFSTASWVKRTLRTSAPRMRIATTTGAAAERAAVRESIVCQLPPQIGTEPP